MKKLFTFFLLIWTLYYFPVAAQKEINLTSPGGSIAFSFKLLHKAPVYSVSFKGRKIIDYSALGLQFSDGQVAHNVKYGKPFF